MPAHQTEHGFKFTSRLEHPLDGSQQEDLHGFTSVFVLRSTEKVVQDVSYPLCSIPFQDVQVVPDGMITVLISNNADSGFDFLFAGNAVFLHPAQNILHVGVAQGFAGARPTHRLYNVDRLPQKSSHVNVNLSGRGPSILLRKTVLSLKSPTGAFIAPLHCANANF